MSDPLFGPPAGDVARVALPLATEELFEYAVPSSLAQSARPGCRARVRFRDRPLTGVIVERVGQPRFEGALLPIERIVDPEPALSEAMIAILREAAAEVLCPLGIALATALPTGSAPRVVRGHEITARGRAALRAGAVRGQAARVLEHLGDTARTRAGLRRLGDPDLLDALEADGLIAARAIEHGPSARPATQRMAELAAGVDVDAAIPETLSRAPRQADLLRRLAERGSAPVAALRSEFPTARALLRSLAERGLVRLHDRPAPRDVLGPPVERDREVVLTPEQADAVKPIADAIRSRRAETFLLHGVTGSGKTEVYLRAVAEALRTGRQALILVPEITLTHQILARLRARFGDDLAVLHSGLRPGERLEQWQRLRGGPTPIAVGARSALFAPLENLGVIVIDEEHDAAYKNDEGFRYHACELATRRAAQAQCPLILGSATPSLETRFLADRGGIQRLVLPSRIGGRPLPAVEIVDLQRERDLAPRGRRIVLSRLLERAMRETLAQGGQTVLLLNRRGFSTQVMCFSCGHAERCVDCDISLVYHATDEQLRCHYCDHRAPPPERCTKCGAPDSALLGLGTQRLEEEVRTRFPEARIARLDRDTAQRRGFTAGVLSDVHHDRLDVLIGTQLVAKGHDFPGVRLVGVVLADIGLHLPDFRAAERTFQLLTQVAGRAGRDRAPGRVIVQTFSPDHYAIRPVREHDYEGFYAEELGHRAALGYPPFGHLVRALVSGPDEDRTREAADALAAAAAPPEGVELLGPAPAPLARLRGRHRIQLLAKGADAELVGAVARRLWKASARLTAPLQAVVDRRPLQML